MKGIADYEFIRPLGTGNYGEYFLATPPARLGLDVDLVAVKVLTLASTGDGFKRAVKELRAFASASSPYLVTLFDAGQQGGAMYYALEYFPMGSLADPNEPPGRRQSLTALTHAARAAHALHEAGIVHRDIQPGNVMLFEDGAKLSDLGLAQFIAPGLTVTGMGPIGSVEYMDPEIIRGRRASRSSDIWSLGVSLHRALTGLSVYDNLSSSDALQALRTVLNERPAIDPSLRSEDADLIDACLAEDPLDRPQTAEEVADRISQLPD